MVPIRHVFGDLPQDFNVGQEEMAAFLANIDANIDDNHSFGSQRICTKSLYRTLIFEWCGLDAWDQMKMTGALMEGLLIIDTTGRISEDCTMKQQIFSNGKWCLESEELFATVHLKETDLGKPRSSISYMQILEILFPPCKDSCHKQVFL